MPIGFEAVTSLMAMRPTKSVAVDPLAVPPPILFPLPFDVVEEAAATRDVSAKNWRTQRVVGFKGLTYASANRPE